MLYLFGSNTTRTKGLQLPIQPLPASIRSKKECFFHQRTNRSSACLTRIKKSPSSTDGGIPDEKPWDHYKVRDPQVCPKAPLQNPQAIATRDCMKTVKIHDVHYSMLKDIGKKWRISQEDLIAELIREIYSSKTKRS